MICWLILVNFKSNMLFWRVRKFAMLQKMGMTLNEKSKKFMTKYVLSLLLLFIIVKHANTQTVRVNAHLCDIQNKNIPYASITISNLNDSLIGGCISDSLGYFSFDAIPPFKLRLSSLGFKDSLIIVEESQNQLIEFGNLKLQSNFSEIEEVEVLAFKKRVESKFDRDVYTVDPEFSASVMTVFDMLRLLPGINVDQSNNIIYKGAKASLFVDNVPLEYFYPSVENIPIELIKKIELIDNAIQSGGTGRGGGINFKMKIPDDKKTNGQFSSQISTVDPQELNSSKTFLNLNWQIKKFTLFNNFDFKSAYSRTTISNEKLIENPNLIADVHFSNINITNKNRTINDFVGTVYRPNEQTNMYLGVGFFDFNYTYLSSSSFAALSNEYNSILIQSSSENLSASAQKNMGLMLNYNKDIDTIGSYHNFYFGYQPSADEFVYHDTTKYSFLNSSPSDSIYLSNTENFGTVTNLYAGSTYNHQFNQNTRFMVSYSLLANLENQNLDKVFENEIYKPEYSDFTHYNSFKNDFNVRFGMRIGKFLYDAGINFSDTYYDAAFKGYHLGVIDTSIYLKKNFFHIQPSATIKYQYNTANLLKLTLSKTSTTPYLHTLNELVLQDSPYEFRSGNSNLLPISYYSAYINYSRIKAKFNSSSDIFYTYSSNEISSVSRPINDLLSSSKYENVASKSTLGISQNFWFKLGKLHSISSDISLYYNTYFLNVDIDPLNQRTLHEAWGYRIKTNGRINLKSYIVNVFIDYIAKAITYNGYNCPTLGSSINVSKGYFVNKLFLSFGISNLIGDYYPKCSNNEQYNIRTTNKTNGTPYYTQITFSLKYRFIKGGRETENLNF